MPEREIASRTRSIAGRDDDADARLIHSSSIHYYDNAALRVLSWIFNSIVIVIIIITITGYFVYLWCMEESSV